MKIETSSMRALRVLVADDNPVNREVALRLLEKQGCVADGAIDGENAIGMHRANPYALILMDCDMPVLDGYLATQRIRAMEGSGRRTPIIALTAGGEDEAERCMAAGMDDFLSKPLRPQALAAVLERWLFPLDESGPISGSMTEPGDCDEVETVRQMFGKDFAELAALYQSDSPPRLAALRQAHADGDTFQLAKVVHALGGSSMSIGATGLAAMCSALEQRAKNGMPDDALQRLAAIEAEYARIVRKLQELLAHV
ncbi:MAG TPA: response regulator [Noviherbaspirillum sp.]|nr:response regulator [Noviherbaspirillum sp.]